MSVVRVSNARRISFTSLAVVAFWVLAWRAYWMGCDDAYDTIVRVLVRRGAPHGSGIAPQPAQSLAFVASMALMPTALLSLAVSNSLRGLRDPWIAASSVLFVASTFVAGLFAREDASVRIGQYDVPTLQSAFPGGIAALRSQHQVSWLYLLLPIILTTAFVIFGAWRRAVRDAEVEAVGEGE